MYDIKPLEEEWKKYKQKQRRPWYLLMVSVLLLSFISFAVLKYDLVELFISSSENNKSVTETTAVQAPITVPVNKVLIEAEFEKEKEVIDTNATKLKEESMPLPDSDFMPSIDKSEVSSSEESIKKPKVKIEPEMVHKPRKKMHLDIVKTTSPSAYKEVEKRFHKFHDADDSLFLASGYYAKGKYKKAEYWALETNKINMNLEESWLIFAKTKAKLGHKNEAMRILKSYMQKTNSEKAKDIFIKIKNGTL